MKLNLLRPLAFIDLETTGINVVKDRIIQMVVPPFECRYGKLGILAVPQPPKLLLTTTRILNNSMKISQAAMTSTGLTGLPDFQYLKHHF
jgi:oligoribonuclease (3'-5' exoribonuclease)